MMNTSFSETPFGFQPRTQLSHSLNIYIKNLVFYQKKLVLQAEQEAYSHKLKQNFYCILFLWKPMSKADIWNNIF